MTKEERLRNIEELLEKTDALIESYQDRPKTFMLGGSLDPLEMLRLALITKEALEASKILEVAPTQEALDTLLKICGAYLLVEKAVSKTIGKKRMKKLKDIKNKYLNRKIDNLDRIINGKE